MESHAAPGTPSGEQPTAEQQTPPADMGWATAVAAVGLGVSLASCLVAVVVRVASGAPPLENRFQFGDMSTSAFLVLVAAFGTVGAILVARQPRHPVGWLLLVVGLAYGTQTAAAVLLSADVAARGRIESNAAWAGWYVDFAGLVAGAALFSAFATFPDGRVPIAGWTRWRGPVLATMVAAGSVWLLRPGPLWHFPSVASPITLWPRDVPDWVVGALTVPPVLAVGVLWVGVLAILAWRARRARGVARQQLKWFALSAAAAATTISTVTVTGALVPTSFPLGELPLTAFVLSAALIPVAIGIAILRYRLYQIDVVIRRTLVYGAVVAILGATYVVLVLALQAVLSGATGGTLPVALSTLAVATLFGRVRSRVRDAVDRRFFRARYDSRQILEAFASQLRAEADLDAVREDLVAAVRETVVPAHAAVWIRPRALR